MQSGPVALRSMDDKKTGPAKRSNASPVPRRGLQHRPKEVLVLFPLMPLERWQVGRHLHHELDGLEKTPKPPQRLEPLPPKQPFEPLERELLMKDGLPEGRLLDGIEFHGLADQVQFLGFHDRLLFTSCVVSS